jgi:hypothetical protein
VRATERLLCLELVVSSAEDLRVLRLARSTARPLDEVVDLEPPTLGAAHSVGRHEGAPKAVARHDLATRRPADLAGILRSLRDPPRPLGLRRDFSLELREQRVHRPVEDGFQDSVRDSMAKEIPRPLELVAKRGASREGHVVPLG